MAQVCVGGLSSLYPHALPHVRTHQEQVNASQGHATAVTVRADTRVARSASHRQRATRGWRSRPTGHCIGAERGVRSPRGVWNLAGGTVRRLSGKSLPASWEIWTIPLMRHDLFLSRLGENACDLNGAKETLNQRVQGSSPCAPTSKNNDLIVAPRCY
jgi:hypothetical protein